MISLWTRSLSSISSTSSIIIIICSIISSSSPQIIIRYIRPVSIICFIYFNKRFSIIPSWSHIWPISTCIYFSPHLWLCVNIFSWIKIKSIIISPLIIKSIRILTCTSQWSSPRSSHITIHQHYHSLIPIYNSCINYIIKCSPTCCKS